MGMMGTRLGNADVCMGMGRCWHACCQNEAASVDMSPAVRHTNSRQQPAHELKAQVANPSTARRLPSRGQCETMIAAYAYLKAQQTKAPV